MTEDTASKVVEMLKQHIDSSAAWQQSQDLRTARMEEGQREMRAELTRNTEVTEAIRDAYTAGRMMTRIVKWVGAIAIAIGSIWWAIKEIAGHGSGIGPTP